MDIGKAILKFVGDTKDVEKKAKGLNDDLKNIAKGGAKVLGGIATAATTALVGVTKKAVQMRGEVEQQIGGTEAVFKEFAKTVQEDSTKAFDKMGISASDYMAYMNKMGSLMQGSGIETKKSMELSSQAMQRAADVASIMGISVDDAMTAISGAAKGNFTMMDNLGVAMNATSLNAYALEKGLKKTYAQMEQGEKVELAMQMFLEKSAYAAGNYAKENDTFAGSLNTLKAAAQNLLAGTGSVDQVMSALTNFGKILVETPYGNKVFCYDIERTICDIIRDKNKIEKYQFVDALKRYTSLKVKDIAKLYKYAEKFGIKDEVKKYIEVLN